MTATLTIRRGSLWRFLQHQYLRFRSTWTGTIVAGLVSPILFLGAIGFGLGSQIDDTSSLGTVDYVSFVGPGVLAATAMIQGGSLGLWPTMAALKWEGTYQAVLSTPLTPTELATGHILWIGFRVLVGAVMYVIVLTVLGVAASWLAVFAPLAAALTGMAFGAPVSAYAATQDGDETFSLIMRLVFTPLFLFSGAFFPVSQLPDSVEWISRITPVWHGVELCRNLINGTPGGGDLGHLAYLLVVVVAGWLFATRTFAGRLAT